jgi:predicted nucleotidyltransferase component of viral defense system
MAKPKRPAGPDLREIRRAILTAVASDDLLFELLVLKGGNALELIHRIGERASLDLDFSMEGDAADPRELEARLKRAVEDRLDSLALLVFDWAFGPRPNTPRGGAERWGGYRAEFKVIERELARSLGGDPGSLRRQAVELDAGHQRVFQIDISKFEFCAGRVTKAVDHYQLQVYTPAMIAAEKLRAICQQMPEYPQRRHPSPRPRDFYDIHAVVTVAGVRLGDHLELIRHMFDAKEVPHRLLGLIARDRERSFHGQVWSAVEQAVRGQVQPFDFYFDFVASCADGLKALWEVDPPVG